METWQAKIIALFSMFFIAFFSGLVSILLVDVISRRGRRRRRPDASSSTDAAGDRRLSGRSGMDTVAGNPDDVTAVTCRHGDTANSFSSVSLSTASKIEGDADELVLDENASCSQSTADRVLSLLNCFAGGVFLATCLLHLLPDARKDVSKVLAASGRESIDFPLAEFITCIGFFVVMVIEQIVVQCRRRHDRGSDEAARPQHGPDDSPDEGPHGHLNTRYQPSPTIKTTASSLDVIGWNNSTDINEQRPMLNKTKSVDADGVNMEKHRLTCCHLANNDQRSTRRTAVSRRELRPSDKGGYGCGATVYGSIGAGAGSDSGVHSALQMAVDRTTSGASDGVVSEADRVDHNKAVHSTRSFVLLLALSIHMVFEGLALGLQDTSAGLWTLFTAVALHKTIMAFTSGLRFAETLPTRRLAVIYVLTFAAMSPLGIGIGTAVSEWGGGGAAADAASALLQGLATGTFLYVTFFEVLNEQLANDDPDVQQSRDSRDGSGLIKVLTVAIGFAFITVLELFAEA